MVLPTAFRKIGSRARVAKLSKPTNVPPTIVAFCSDSTKAWTTGMSVNSAKNARVGAMKTYDQACLRANKTIRRCALNKFLAVDARRRRLPKKLVYIALLVGLVEQRLGLGGDFVQGLF